MVCIPDLYLTYKIENFKVVGNQLAIYIIYIAIHNIYNIFIECDIKIGN